MSPLRIVHLPSVADALRGSFLIVSLTKETVSWSFSDAQRRP